MFAVAAPGVNSEGSYLAVPAASQSNTPLPVREGESSARSLSNWRWENIRAIGKGLLRGVYITFLTNGILMNINNAVRDFFRHSQVIQTITKELGKVFSAVGFSETLLVPIALYNIGHDIYGLIRGEITVSEFLLSVGENLGFILLSIVDLLKLLVEIGKIPLEALKYLTPFSLIRLVLDGIMLISCAKGWAESNQLAREMESRLAGVSKNKDGEQIKSYRSLFTYLCDEAQFSNHSVSLHFGVEGENLRQRIKDVVMPALLIMETGETFDEKNRADLFVTDCYRALKGRVKLNNISNKLGVTNALVNGFVHGGLFASPFIVAACPVAAPIIPTLFAIGAANACIALAKSVLDIVKQYKFQHSALFKDTKAVATSLAKRSISSYGMGQLGAS